MKYFSLLFILLFAACSSQQKGYSDLDALYSDFVTVIKTNDTSKIKEYCHAITPDQGTVDYMKKTKFSYRGIPKELEKRKLKASMIGDLYYKQVLYFQERLQRNGQLADLKYLGRERQGERVYNKDLDILFTETLILMTSGKDTIKCKLGEMFRIDGKWKSFTEPKLGW